MKAAQLGAKDWIIGLVSLVLLFIRSSSSSLAFALWLPVYAMRITSFVIVGALHVLVMVLAIVKKWPMELALTFYGYALAVLITCFCIMCIQRSIKLGAIRRVYFFAVGTLWIIATVSVVHFYYQISSQLPFTIPTAGVAFGTAMLLVPLASTTVAPLAYAIHRNG